MAAEAERIGRDWVISQKFTGEDGIERKVYWGRAGGWVSSVTEIVRLEDFYDWKRRPKDNLSSGWLAELPGETIARTFASEQAAQAYFPELPPISEKPVVCDSKISIEWDDMHRMSAGNSRAEDLIARGRIQGDDLVDAKSWIQSIRSGDPNRGELALRLRDLCERTEARPTAAESVDDSAFVLVSKLELEFGLSTKEMRKILGKHPEIRQRKPSQNRREVHAADFVRFRNKEAEQGLSDGSIAQQITEAGQRSEAIKSSWTPQQERKRATGARLPKT
ncbi:MAG TPA: hypothetical protein VFG04_08170 [Planctomycetaceae bacterium]|jgi:hypothetical protein|nr:hypothetical protein [Planctomycetaceae bacterium]